MSTEHTHTIVCSVWHTLIIKCAHFTLKTCLRIRLFECAELTLRFADYFCLDITLTQSISNTRGSRRGWHYCCTSIPLFAWAWIGWVRAVETNTLQCSFGFVYTWAQASLSVVQISVCLRNLILRWEELLLVIFSILALSTTLPPWSLLGTQDSSIVVVTAILTSNLIKSPFKIRTAEAIV